MKREVWKSWLKGTQVRLGLQWAAYPSFRGHQSNPSLLTPSPPLHPNLPKETP